MSIKGWVKYHDEITKIRSKFARAVAKDMTELYKADKFLRLKKKL